MMVCVKLNANNYVPERAPTNSVLKYTIYICCACIYVVQSFYTAVNKSELAGKVFS